MLDSSSSKPLGVLSESPRPEISLMSSSASYSVTRAELVKFKIKMHILGPIVKITDEELNTSGPLKFNLIAEGSYMERVVANFLDSIDSFFGILKEDITAADKQQLLPLVKGFDKLALTLADGAIPPKKRLEELNKYVAILAGAVRFNSPFAPQYDQSFAAPQYQLDQLRAALKSEIDAGSYVKKVMKESSSSSSLSCPCWS